MLNKVVDYKVVSVTQSTAGAVDMLEKAVKKMMAEDWVPSGVPVQLGDRFCQTMVKFG